MIYTHSFYKLSMERSLQTIIKRRKFSKSVLDNNRLDLLMEMEQHFDNKDEEYFKKLVNHNDLVIRTRAVCILADISGEKAIPILYHDILKCARKINTGIESTNIKYFILSISITCV